MKTGGREGLAKGMAPIRSTNSSPRSGLDTLPWIVIYICISELYALFRLWLLSTPLASLLTRKGPSFVKCFLSFLISPTLSNLIAKQTIITSAGGKWRQDRSLRKRTDRLQLRAELMSELPLYFFQTPLSFLL